MITAVVPNNCQDFIEMGIIIAPIEATNIVNENNMSCYRGLKYGLEFGTDRCVHLTFSS